MKKLVLTYGIIGGLVVASMLIITTTIYHQSGNIEGGAIYGYASMLLAFSLIFFGIKKYRDQNNEGNITFGTAFKMGFLITLIASTIYVITWLIDYYYFMPDFMEKYAEQTITKLRNEGAAQDVIEKTTNEMANFAELYKNPFFNAMITFAEILPVGLIVTLISSAILRKQP
ncbi:MAG: hypothetical protein RIR48_647 [Bacteroidota bacterium]